MITPPQTTYYVMELFDHGGPESLDAIASRVYGRKYSGSRSLGDQAPGNDTNLTYDMSAGSLDYVDSIEGFDSESTLVWDSDLRELKEVPMTPLDYWLSLEGKRPSYRVSDPSWDPGEDRDVQESAPYLPWVLADLIRRGELPHGHYLLKHWW